MNYWDRIKKDLKINKEGIVGGAIVGVIVATYIKFTGMPLSLYESAKGFLFDRAVTLAPQQKEVIILYATSILFCSIIGYFLDKIIKPKV